MVLRKMLLLEPYRVGQNSGSAKKVPVPIYAVLNPITPDGGDVIIGYGGREFRISKIDYNRANRLIQVNERKETVEQTLRATSEAETSIRKAGDSAMNGIAAIAESLFR